MSPAITKATLAVIGKTGVLVVRLAKSLCEVDQSWETPRAELIHALACLREAREAEGL